jgi:N,N'-diacetyllegionaminate synthase
VSFEIAGRPIGPSEPVFVIAEIGLNHGGVPTRALEMVDAAAWAGASAVKLQTIDAQALVAAHCPPPAHVGATSLREFFRRFELDVDAHRAVIARARAHGLAVLSTPFSESAVAMLSALGLDAFKIASGDLTYDGLITAAAATHRPLIISTGMSELGEVRHALDVAVRGGARDVALLHCVSSYPTAADSENLGAIITLRDAMRVPVGLSDHGAGLVSAVTAAALGGCIYERHLVLDHDHDAIDRAVSSTPQQLKDIVAALAHTRAAFGDGRKRCLPAEAVNRTPSRRGLYALRALRAGHALTRDDIAILRPAAALGPRDVDWILGARLTRDIEAGTAFARADVAQAALA